MKRVFIWRMNAPSSVPRGVVLFLVLWEGFERGWWAELLQPLLGPQAARFQLKPIFISSPTRIARTAFDMFFVTGAIWKDLGWSSLEFVLGVALAFAIGIPLGLAAGWYRRFNYAVEPFLAALNATPQVAFLPLLILWVGTGLASRVLIIVLLAVLPIAISALAAVRTADARLVRVARSFSAGDGCCSAASSCPARCRSCWPARGLPSGAA